MERFSEIGAYRDWRDRIGRDSSVGFVPTMGALHEGHRALIARAREDCDQVVVSIFVNPTQFNQSVDFDTYPQPLEQDLAVCRAMDVDAVFLPAKDTLYPDGYRYRVSESAKSREMEGAFRPGHFDGVLTVVIKLFQIVRPDRAYFGEKDWQQLQLVRGMVAAFFLPVEVVPCPTVRDRAGLALSSRNSRLSPQALERARMLNRILKSAESDGEAAEELRSRGFEVEYVCDKNARRLAAVVLEGVRLIDNVKR